MENTNSQNSSVLELTEILGKLGSAFKSSDLSRTNLALWRETYQATGVEGLKQLAEQEKRTAALTPEIEQQIIDLSLLHPSYGCNKLEPLLRESGITLSYVTIQKALELHGLNTAISRWMELEKEYTEGETILTNDQIEFIEKQNPSFLDRDLVVNHPGEIISQDVFVLGKLKNSQRIYLHVAIDIFSGYAFAFVHASKKPEAAAALLHDQVIPFFKKYDMQIGEIRTDMGNEFQGNTAHPFELYLMLNNISHYKIDNAVNGTAKSFILNFKKDFLQTIPEEGFEDILDLKDKVNKWMHKYNNETLQFTSRNWGEIPASILNIFVAQTSTL